MASIGYTGTKGTHLSSAILQLNQMDPKYFNQYGRDLLNSAATSPAAVTAGIKLPYAGFTGTVAQALRPFPHYGAVETNNSSVGERAGDSTYHAMIAKLDKRYSSGLDFARQLRVLQDVLELGECAVGGTRQHGPTGSLQPATRQRTEQ